MPLAIAKEVLQNEFHIGRRTMDGTGNRNVGSSDLPLDSNRTPGERRRLPGPGGREGNPAPSFFGPKDEYHRSLGQGNDRRHRGNRAGASHRLSLPSLGKSAPRTQ